MHCYISLLSISSDQIAARVSYFTYLSMLCAFLPIFTQTDTLVESVDWKVLIFYNKYVSTDISLMYFFSLSLVIYSLMRFLGHFFFFLVWRNCNKVFFSCVYEYALPTTPWKTCPLPPAHCHPLLFLCHNHFNRRYGSSWLLWRVFPQRWVRLKLFGVLVDYLFIFSWEIFSEIIFWVFRDEVLSFFWGVRDPRPELLPR